MAKDQSYQDDKFFEGDKEYFFLKFKNVSYEISSDSGPPDNVSTDSNLVYINLQIHYYINIKQL